MRGKNIVSIPLVAMIVCAMMMSVAVAQGNRIYVDPPLISNKDLSMEYFVVSVKVEDVVDFYTYAFELRFAKYISILAVDKVLEGDFFKGAPGYDPLEFTVKIKGFEGSVAVGFTLRGDVPGLTGSGTLALIRFQVLEAGVSPLHLENVALYNSKGKSIRDVIEHGYYDGPVVNLIRGKLGSRPKAVGETQTFDVRVKNEGAIPLKAWAKIENVRLEDGKLFTLHSGQTFETLPPKDPAYLYVDGFSPWLVQWDTVGTEPWLDAIEDGNYIEATEDGALMGIWTFEDIALGPEDLVSSVSLEGYTNGPLNDGVDYDMYDQHFCWIGSLYGKGDPWWVTPRWVGASASEVCPDLLTEAGLNAFMAIAYFYDPDLYGGPGNIIDCLRLKVEFAPYLISPVETPVYTVLPGEEMDFDLATWTPLKAWDVAKYAVSIIVYCTYNEFAWVPGPKVQTRTWWVTP